MADTTIKIGADVRDRLAVLAAESGTTIREFVSRWARATPTRAELHRRELDAVAYVKAHIRPDFGPDDLAAGHRIWMDIEAGRLPGAADIREIEE